MDMNNKDIERKLYEEFEERKPELFQEILKYTPKMVKRQKVTFWQKLSLLLTPKRTSISLTMIAAIIVFGLILFNPFGSSTPLTYSTIAIDVNPSLVLELDEDDRVIQVQKNNDDAIAIIGNMDLIGVDSKVAINALIGSMIANGYITEFSNSVLLSIKSSDSIHEDELKIALSTAISNLLSGTSINGSVITQSLNFSEEAKTIAETYDISEAKAELIIDIVAIDPTISIYALSLLSINDLNLLLDAKNYVFDNVTKSGSASQLELLTKQEAYDIATLHLGLDPLSILDYDIELEQEDGIMIYEIEIETATNEYQVVINAKQGTILETEIEIIDGDDTDDYPDDVLDIQTLKTMIYNELDLDVLLVNEFDIDYELKNDVPIFNIEIDYNDNEIILTVNAITGQIYSNSYNPDGYHYQDYDDEDEIDDDEDEIDDDEDEIDDDE
jgi:uncharacterized membrane protein YkoI